MATNLTTEDVNAAITGSVRDLGYSSLKEKQKQVIVNFLKGNDVFVVLRETSLLSTLLSPTLLSRSKLHPRHRRRAISKIASRVATSSFIYFILMILQPCNSTKHK